MKMSKTKRDQFLFSASEPSADGNLSESSL
jgi:hypothetical protein